MAEAPTIRISKLNAARRQLDVAIKLWFADEDEVSVHTLAAAAHQIIHDINQKKGGRELLFDSIVIKDEYRSEFIAFIKRDMNFFKHADQDPEGITEFVPMGSLMFLLCSAAGLQQLGESLNDVEDIFLLWLAIHRPNWISGEFRQKLQDSIPVEHLERIQGCSKKEFFQGLLRARAEFRAMGRI